MLEQVSDTRGLSCGLQFLCSNKSSLYATTLGFKHAMKLVIFSKYFLIIMWLMNTHSLCVYGYNLRGGYGSQMAQKEENINSLCIL